MKQKYEIRSHFRTKFHSRILFYFIFLFFSLFFLRLSFPPIRLRVLYPVLVNIRGRKRKKFKKVFSGNCWEESYPQLEGKFHPSYLNFCPAFVALEREKFLGQFSPNVQIPSNFPRIAFRDNFAFQTFSRIFNPPSKKRNGILFLFLRYSISHCQRIRLPFPFLLPLSSNFIVQSSLCCPTIFKCCFAPHGAHRSIRKGLPKLVSTPLEQHAYHVPSGCRGNSLLFVMNTGGKIV